MGCNVWPLLRSWSTQFRENEFPKNFFREIRSVVFSGVGSHLIQMLLKVGQKGWHGNFNKGKVDGLTVNPIFISITTDFSGRFTIILIEQCTSTLVVVMSKNDLFFVKIKVASNCKYFRKLYRNAELDRILRKVTWNNCTFQCYELFRISDNLFRNCNFWPNNTLTSESWKHWRLLIIVVMKSCKAKIFKN